VTRRASLPGVDELFRSSRDNGPDNGQETNPQVDVQEPPAQPVSPAAPVQPSPAPAPPVAVEAGTAPSAVPEPEAEAPEAEGARRPRHDEKVTFYCTASDLTRIERARLALRADHRLASDRGRIVRAALAEILDDFESRGSESALVRRLRADKP